MSNEPTKADRAILAALDKYPDGVMPGILARDHGIRTMSPRETASRHLIKLTKLGLAEKDGTRVWPRWRITEAGRKALSETDPTP